MRFNFTFSKLKNILLDQRFVFVIWCLAIAYAVLVKGLQGPTHYNNFMIFRGVADHLFSSLPLYGMYPLEYHDANHYGPLFGFIIAPFSVIPHWLAMPLWVISMSMILYWTVRRLPLPVHLTSLVLLLTVNDLYSACLLQQFNIAVAALIVGSLVMIERRREGWAALFIVIGTFVKIYGIVGLGFFFFVQRKWRFIGFMALWSVIALLGPLVVVSPEYLWSQYAAWGADIMQKNAENMFCEYTNISFVGAVRKISGSANYSDMLVIIPAMIAFSVSYLRIDQYKRLGFRLVMLSAILLSVVLFSSGSETSGYVIAAVGVGIWWVTLQYRGWIEWTLLGLMLVASFGYPIFPKAFYDGMFTQYALRSLPYFCIWLHCIFRLWSERFSTENDYIV